MAFTSENRWMKINVPVVYMGRYEVVLRVDYPLRKAFFFWGGGPKNREFFGPSMALATLVPLYIVKIYRNMKGT
jgi:hypothetical protein